MSVPAWPEGPSLVPVDSIGHRDLFRAPTAQTLYLSHLCIAKADRGNPLETTIALSHLIFEGTFDRFPGLKICAAHGGGYLPSYAGALGSGLPDLS